MSPSEKAEKIIETFCDADLRATKIAQGIDPFHSMTISDLLFLGTEKTANDGHRLRLQ